MAGIIRWKRTCEQSLESPAIAHDWISPPGRYAPYGLIQSTIDPKVSLRFSKKLFDNGGHFIP